MLNNDFYGVSKLIEENGGIKNFRCFALMEPMDVIPVLGIALAHGQPTWVECRVDERRYKVSDDYKITLVPTKPGFAYKHYYQSDFASLIKRGYIIIKTNPSQAVHHHVWTECIGGKVYLIHEGDLVG